MTEPAAEPTGGYLGQTTETPPPVTDTPPPDDTQQQLGEGGERALTAERELRKAAERAVRERDRELSRLRQASMSEQERAIEQARNETRQATLGEVGKRLARAELRAAAGSLGVTVDEATLDELDLSRFLTDDGEPNTERINATVSRWKAMTGPTRNPSFDGGVRSPAPAPTNMNDFIRTQVGIRPT